MSNANALELGMLDLINGERAAAGLAPLRLITRLNEAAETHSQWMLDADQFSHSGAGGSSPSDRMEDAGYPFEGNYLALENIGWQSSRGAAGFEDDVAQVHAGLMASPGHRANILNPDAEDIGIGIEIGNFTSNNGDFEAVMVTQVFGSTDADISQWVDPGTGQAADDDPMPVDDPTEAPDTDATPEGGEEDPANSPDDTPTGKDGPTDRPTDGQDPDPEEPGDTPVAVDEPVDGQDAPDPEETADTPVAETDPTDTPVEEQNTPDPEHPDTMPEIALPCELTQFTVDLSEAFEFSQEGDQLVWTTSEDKLTEVFMKAFNQWTTSMDEPDAEIEADISDLMMDDVSEQTHSGLQDDDEDDWFLSDCA